MSGTPHTCHWRGCKRQVDPKRWGCVTHWYALPKRLRDAIWREYRAGQEIRKDPSPAYIKVIAEVDHWIAEYEKNQKEQLDLL